jgi:hypothetical protein
MCFSLKVKIGCMFRPPRWSPSSIITSLTGRNFCHWHLTWRYTSGYLPCVQHNWYKYIKLLLRSVFLNTLHFRSGFYKRKLFCSSSAYSSPRGPLWSYVADTVTHNGPTNAEQRDARGRPPTGKASRSPHLRSEQRRCPRKSWVVYYSVLKQ